MKEYVIQSNNKAIRKWIDNVVDYKFSNSKVALVFHNKTKVCFHGSNQIMHVILNIFGITEETKARSITKT